MTTRQNKQAPVQTTEVKTEEVKVEVKAPRVTIASQIIAKIMEGGKTNEQILKEVKESNPTCKTTYACIAWYQSKLRKEGKIGPRVFAKKVEAEVKVA